jgi:hypothetical protein
MATWNRILAGVLLLTACDKQTAVQKKDEPQKAAAPKADAATHTVNFVNNCDQTVWVGSTGNAGFAGLNSGGWEMGKKGSGTDNTTVQVEVGWQGHVWPRTGCTFNAQNLCDGYTPCCASGSCLTSDNKTFGLECAQSGVPPVGIIEFTFDAAGGYGPYDTYDASFVDGWGVGVAVEAVAGTYNPTPDPGLQAPWCTQAGCTAAPTCPAGLGAADGSCWSPCQNAVNNQEPDSTQTKLCCACSMKDPISCGDAGCAYGCSPYSNPPNPADQTCDPWSTDSSRAWDQTSQDYIANVKKVCPQVYSWQFDDKAATFNCRKTDGLVDYTITFCPG